MDDEFSVKDFYDQVQAGYRALEGDLKNRHVARALKEALHIMDKQGMRMEANDVSPGAKAAHQAAVPDAQAKEMEGRMRILDDSKKPERGDPVPVENQPTSFDEAASKAHDTYMAALGKIEK